MFHKSRTYIILIVILIFSGAILGYFWYKSLTSRIFVSLLDPSVEVVSPTPNPYGNSIQEYLAKKRPFNILLLGYGGASHDGTYLTDTMIVANINPSTSRITLISIPRDIWVATPPDDAYRKINAAFYENLSSGPAIAGKTARDAVSVVTGLPIHYFVSVDFAGFRKIIDTLGGIDVKVDVAFDDYQYPVSGRENDLCGKDPSELPAILATASATTQPQEIFPCRYEHLHFDKGIAHLDGETALKFVRSRHSVEDGSDFGRSRRQKNLLVAVKQKIITLNFLPKIIPFVNSLGSSVRTDLTVEEGAELVQNSQTLGQYTITSLALTDANYLADSYSSDGQFILVPQAGFDQWSAVHQWLAGELSSPATPSASQI